MELGDFKALLACHFDGRRCLNSAEGLQALVLADAIKRFTRQRAERAIQSSATSPAVMTHMSDGWGAWCNTTSRGTPTQGTHLVTTRTGKFRHEFLLQRALLRVHTADGQAIFLLAGDPEGLNKGKGAWNVFSGTVRFMRTLREMGHRGLCANVYVVDGALYQSLARKFIARHRLQAMLLEASDDERALLQAQEFTLAIKCVSHGCNNGTKWGMKIVAPDRSIIDDAHICTKSLSNCSTAFHCHIDLFITRFLTFVPERSCSMDEALAFWLCLGMHAEVADNLSRADLRWDGERLCAHLAFQDEPGAVSQIAGMVLHLMRWRDYSETRWCGSGPSGRLFLGALAGGMDGIHEICRADPHCSEEKMAGIRRATPPVRLFLAVAALSSFPTECVGLELLDDDRFLRRGRELFQVMEDELKYLHGLPPSVWSRIAPLISAQTEPTELRDICLLAAHIGCAYLWDDSFEQLNRSPLNITQGDIAANVAAVGAGTWDLSGRDTQAAQIRACLDMGVPAAQLTKLFETIRDSAATINIVEQGHASHACILRQHEQLQERLLRARSTIIQCRAMLTTEQRSRVARLEQALERNYRQQVQRCPFRAFSSLFTDEQVAAALNMEWRGWSPTERWAARRQLFARLPHPLMRLVDEYSIAHANERRRSLQEERARLLEELATARAVAAENREERGLSNHVSDCKFSDRELEELMQTYLATSPNDRHRAQHAPLQPVEVPNERVREAIEQHQTSEDGNNILPWWARHISARRDHFRSTAISTQEDFQQAWAVLCCKQGQMKVVSLELRRVRRAIDPDGGVDEFLDKRKIIFELFPLSYAKASDIHVGADDQLFVLPNLFFEGYHMCCMSEPVSFDEFMRGLPADAGKDRARAAGPKKERVPKAAAGFRESLLASHPWLSQADLDSALGKGPSGAKRSRAPAHRRRPSSSSGEDSEQERRQESTEEEEAGEAAEPELQVYDPSDLASMRALRAVAEHRDMDFYVRILGGAWTLRHTGEVADGCSYFARSGDPTTWCRTFQFPRQRGYHYRKFGGRDAPHILCNEVAARAQHFYDIWCGSDGGSFAYSAEDLASYEAGAEFQAWFAELAPGSVAHRAALLVEQLYPVNPV